MCVTWIDLLQPVQRRFYSWFVIKTSKQAHLHVLILLLLLFLTALTLLLSLLQPFDKRSGLGVDLFGKFLGDVLFRNLVAKRWICEFSTLKFFFILYSY